MPLDPNEQFLTGQGLTDSAADLRAEADKLEEMGRVIKSQEKEAIVLVMARLTALGSRVSVAGADIFARIKAFQRDFRD